jgi:hypothetical protein
MKEDGEERINDKNKAKIYSQKKEGEQGRRV